MTRLAAAKIFVPFPAASARARARERTDYNTGCPKKVRPSLGNICHFCAENAFVNVDLEILKDFGNNFSYFIEMLFFSIKMYEETDANEMEKLTFNRAFVVKGIKLKA